MRRSLWIALLLLGLAVWWCATIFWKPMLWSGNSLANEAVAELRAERATLDATVWNAELEAQSREQYFVKLWDDLRNQDDKFGVLKQIDVESIGFAKKSGSEDCGNGVTRISFATDGDSFSRKQWCDFLDHCKSDGYRLEQCEFHHQKFQQGASGDARSRVSFVLHVTNENRPERIDVHGNLDVPWSETKNANGHLMPIRLRATEATMLLREQPAAFETAYSTSGVGMEGPANWEDVLVADLNADGLSDFVHLTSNRVYWNKGECQFSTGKLCEFPVDRIAGGALADFTGDGVIDLLITRRPTGPESDTTVALVIYRGTEDFDPKQSRFAAKAYAALVSPIALNSPDAFAFGDVNGDGALDLWLTQYKMPYRGGQMPTPYYDANDGWPSYLLLSDGKGRFADATENSGLVPKRHRRTYRSSFVDVDEDGDLDLVVVSDFAGLDIHANDGKGHFEDVTKSLVEESSNFGMAHAFGDFNNDRRLDFYVAGMASTTARRLDQLGLRRKGYDEHQSMRTVIAYGNRMYLADGDTFSEPSYRDQVARCGWSWGCGSFDFDSDGDVDIYVANGHNSGDSCKDYCTTFWRHDIYTGSSKEEPAIDLLFTEDLLSGYYTNEGGLQKRESWNGYEHNRLLMNQSGKGFLNVAYLMGVADEADSRQLVVDDFDLDGKPDLLLGRLNRQGSTKLEFLVLKNKWPEDNHWIGVRLKGVAGISPFGARVTVEYEGGGQTAAIVGGDSFASQSAPLKHFGLGIRDSVKSIRVRWPNGQTQEIPDPAIDRYHTISPLKSER